MNNISTKKVEFIDEFGTYEFDSSLKACFISSCINSNITLHVKSEINILFFHDENSSTSKIKILLEAPKAIVNIREIVLTTKKNVFKKEVEITHLSKKTISDYKFFGFAINESNLNISAKSSIRKGMSGSEAHQILRVLTDDTAKAQGQPGLFIDDFDVKASHGNSIGQVSEREMYYLQSKGIPKKEARWMIIEGYMVEALNILEQTKQNEIINNLKMKLGVM